MGTMKLSRSELIKRSDRLFSLRVRYGNAIEHQHQLFCICWSCGKKTPFNKIDNGHFISRQVYPLRWDLANCHPECHYDNRFNQDHLIGYTISMANQFGIDKVKELHEIEKKWRSGKISAPKIKELREIYNENLRVVRELSSKFGKLIPDSWKEE